MLAVGARISIGALNFFLPATVTTESASAFLLLTTTHQLIVGLVLRSFHSSSDSLSREEKTEGENRLERSLEGTGADGRNDNVIAEKR